ncbi:hypothetical protein LTR08_000255 [Meristemomyces frigidus]|nr:hypothetical protein LTR08_000255 [Meristemomyces frigidus]
MGSSDSEDEDFKKAVALSLVLNAATDDLTTETATAAADMKPATEATRVATGIPGLDRQAMEQERLARNVGRKRERSISPPARRDPRKAPRLDEVSITLPSGARLNTLSSLVQQDQAGRKSTTANEATNRLLVQQPTPTSVDELGTKPSATAAGGLLYPRGVVKKTWAFGHGRTGNEIKLEEVLESATLRTAVLSAFQWDTDWVLGKLKIPPNGGSTKCVFVMQAKDEALKQQIMKETEDMRPFLRLCFPPMDGQIFCMHSKLMLLFHAHKLRVAVPSANLLNFDWGETGAMENSVFLIDLPRLPDGRETSIENLTFFAKELIYFLEKSGIDQDVREGVLKFDFSATKGMAFVHTVGGTFHQDEAERTGLPGLGRAVRHLGLQTDDVEIDFAASSIGSLNDDQLRSIHSAAKGEDLISRASGMLAKAKASFFSPSASKTPSKAASIRDKIRIYFPTRETVTASTAGAAGTICLSRKWYENMPFPRACFRDYVSVRKGLLSHNKILLARGKGTASKDTAAKDVAWAYVGSANMSESAWGKLVYDKKEKAWKINCRNWECGVLLPVPAEKLEASMPKNESLAEKPKDDDEGSETESEAEGPESGGATSSVELVGLEVFKGLVDLPFEHPGRTFDGREPWYFQERQS